MWRACSSDLNLPIIPYDSILLNDNKFVQHRNRKKTGHWLAVVKREKEKNLRGGGMACFSCCWSFFLFLLFSYIFFFPRCNDPQARNNEKNEFRNQYMYSNASPLSFSFFSSWRKEKKRKKERTKVNIPHDTTDCFAVLHVSHEFFLIYYTLTCFDGHARNWKELANVELPVRPTVSDDR